MNLQETEKKFNFKFPQKWMDIYNTGAMEWLECNSDEFNAKREVYISNPNAFFMLNCDCEPLLFDKISERIEDLNEWISWCEEDEELSLKENIKLIPFGQTGAGDLYCFLYEDDTYIEPKVILYLHDEYEEPDIIGETFEEYLYVQMLSAVTNDEDVQGEHWQAHLKHLSDDYKNLLVNKTAEELINDYDNIKFKQAEIWYE